MNGLAKPAPQTKSKAKAKRALLKEQGFFQNRPLSRILRYLVEAKRSARVGNGSAGRHTIRSDGARGGTKGLWRVTFLFAQFFGVHDRQRNLLALPNNRTALCCRLDAALTRCELRMRRHQKGGLRCPTA
jgi:hypothetical protein